MKTNVPTPWQTTGLVLVLFMAAIRPASADVDRHSHGSIRHDDVGVYRREGGEEHRHRDVEVDRGFRPNWGWGGFVAGAVVGSVPRPYETVVVNGSPYYYSQGTYYQSGPSGYVAVNPPSGAAVTGPPPGAIPVAYGNQIFYYVDGVFYQQQGSTYVVSATPIGVTVPELPSGATQAIINGLVYYQLQRCVLPTQLPKWRHRLHDCPTLDFKLSLMEFL